MYLRQPIAVVGCAGLCAGSTLVPSSKITGIIHLYKLPQKAGYNRFHLGGEYKTSVSPMIGARDARGHQFTLPSARMNIHVGIAPQRLAHNQHQLLKKLLNAI